MSNFMCIIAVWLRIFTHRASGSQCYVRSDMPAHRTQRNCLLRFSGQSSPRGFTICQLTWTQPTPVCEALLNERKDHLCVFGLWRRRVRGFCSHDSELEPSQSQWKSKKKNHRISATDSWIVAEAAWWEAHPGFQSKWHFRSRAAWQPFPSTSLSADHLHSNWSEAQSSCSYPRDESGMATK